MPLSITASHPHRLQRVVKVSYQHLNPHVNSHTPVQTDYYADFTDANHGPRQKGQLVRMPYPALRHRFLSLSECHALDPQDRFIERELRVVGRAFAALSSLMLQIEGLKSEQGATRQQELASQLTHDLLGCIQQRAALQPNWSRQVLSCGVGSL